MRETKKTCRQRERESERDLRPRVSSEHVVKVRFSDAVIYADSDPDHFGRTADHLRFSSCERLPKSRCFAEIWQSDTSSVFGWTCVRLSLEVLRGLEDAVSAEEDESIGSCQCFNCGGWRSIHCCFSPTLCLSPLFLLCLFSFYCSTFLKKIPALLGLKDSL